MERMIMSYTKEQAIEVYVCVRKHNHSIPDEALDSMKAALLAFPELVQVLDDAIKMVNAKSGMDQVVIGRMYAALNKAKG